MHLQEYFFINYADAQINHGIMHMSCLTELDLCEIPEVFHDQIQVEQLILDT